MTTEGMGIHKISVQLMAEIEAGEVITEAIVSNRSRSRERSLSPREYDNNNSQNGSSRFRSGSRSRSSSRITTNRDRIRCYRCQRV